MSSPAFGVFSQQNEPTVYHNEIIGGRDLDPLGLFIPDWIYVQPAIDRNPIENL